MTCPRYKMVLSLMELNDTSMCDAIYAVNEKKCSFSSDVKHVLDSMLCVNHQKRYTIGDIQSMKCLNVYRTDNIRCESSKASSHSEAICDEQSTTKRRKVY